jgi:hypothetical protein
MVRLIVEDQNVMRCILDRLLHVPRLTPAIELKITQLHKYVSS